MKSKLTTKIYMLNLGNVESFQLKNTMVLEVQLVAHP